jgi:hypothetical protein
MENSADDWQHDLVLALANAVKDSKGMDLSEMLGMYDGIAERFLPLVADDEFRQQETRRRIAEFVLIAATDNQYPLSVCRHFLDDLTALGFSVPEKRWMYDLIFARYCLDVGYVDEGLQIMTSDEAELEAGYRDQYALLTKGPARVEASLKAEGEPGSGLREESWVRLLEELSLALDKLRQGTRGLKCDDILAEYGKVNSHFLDLAGSAEEVQCEIRARVGENTLHALIENECEFELCQRLLEEISSTAFVTVDARIRPVLGYCEYADRIGKTEKSEEALGKLHADLTTESNTLATDHCQVMVKAISMLRYYRFYWLLVRQRLAELRRRGEAVQPASGNS